MKQGLVYVYTGDGKGKTSAAIGTAVRAVGAGMKVGWVAFYKQESWKLSETAMLKKLGVEVFLMGKGFDLKGKKAMPVAGGAMVIDKASEADHKAAAQAALGKAKELLGKVNLLVLDEVNNAIADGLIKVEEVLELLKERHKTHVVITGRAAATEIIKLAGLVTDMRKVKHPYDKGKLAVKGLDF